MFKLLVSIFALSVSVPAYAQFRSDSCNCPGPDGPPDSGSYGRHIPHFADIQPHRSPDGHYMAYVTPSGQAFVMDLTTHTSQEILIQPRYANEIVDYVYPPVWCPYDPDVVLMTVRSEVDTTGGTGSSFDVYNIYKYSIWAQESACITPDTLGKFGAPSQGQLTFGASYWVAGSQIGADSLLVGMAASVSPDHKQFWGLYLPQTQQLIRTSDDIPDTQTIAISADSVHRVWLHFDMRTGQTILPVMFDTLPLVFSVPLDTTSGNVEAATFSPDGKWVAYWVFPQGNGAPFDTSFDQVWICPVSNPTKIEHVINFQCLYCTYSFWGIYPEFISDSTLAVSMHHDGDSVSALWEIGLDGHIVRQLTHVAGSKVAKSDLRTPALAYPNPAHNALTIELLKPGTVTVIDEMGRTILTQSLPFGSSRVDISKLASGAYTLRSSDGYTRIIIK